jgi:hypothetical protein
VIRISLVCSACGRSFLITAQVSSFVLRADLERLRKRAGASGWERLRVGAQLYPDDYCGVCAPTLRAAQRPRNRGAR